jgi:hypothetical protein
MEGEPARLMLPIISLVSEESIMQIARMLLRSMSLAAVLLIPAVNAAPQKINPGDIAVPMSAAPQAPPAHSEPELPGPGMPLPVPSSMSSGGLAAPVQSGDDAIRIRALPQDADLRRHAPAPQQVEGPMPHSENGVRWLCGGVGLEESARMKQEARNYAIMLTFAARDGSYLADVKVRVVDNRGQPVLDTTCDSPILLIDPGRAGRYRITAQTGGATLTRTAAFTSGQHGKSVVMVWPVGPSEVDPNAAGPRQH